MLSLMFMSKTLLEFLKRPQVRLLTMWTTHRGMAPYEQRYHTEGLSDLVGDNRTHYGNREASRK